MAEMSPLPRRMIEDMKIRNLSPATQRCYVHAVAKFSRYFKRSPDGLDLAEVRAYQVHLVMAQTIAIERVDHIGIRVRDPRPRPGLLPGARVHPGTSGRGRRRRHRQLAAKFVDANKRRFGLRGGGVVLSRAARHTSSTQAAGPSEGVGPRDAMGQAARRWHHRRCG